MRFNIPRPAIFTAAWLFYNLTGVNAGLLIQLDATSLPTGALATWSNTGSLAGNFTSGGTTPSVVTVNGVKGVAFNGSSNWYLGPTAPASLTGNGSRTVIAWVHNPSVAETETVIAWGRRDGPDKTLAAFFHGNHDSWGCYGGWGAGDVGWSNQEKTGVWTCCAWVYDNATGIFDAYTDGTLSTTKSVGPLSTWSTSTSNGALPIRVGAQSAANGSVTQINASLTIARIEVHDTALSRSEVIAAYASHAAGFGLNPMVLDYFKASPEVIYLGDSATLDWHVLGEDSLVMNPAMDLTGGAPILVSPTEDTTYTLSATRAGVTVNASATVRVLPGAPVAGDLDLSANQDASAAVTLAAVDPNPPAGGLTWEITAPPAHGTLSGTAPALTYTPDPGYHGADSFKFRASDGFNTSNTATVSIRVNPPPGDPTGVTLSSQTIATSAVSGSFTANLAAVDPNYGESHTYQLVSGDGDTDNTLFSIEGNQLIARGGFAGQDGHVFSIRVRVTDNTGRSFEQILQITAEDRPQSVVINEIFHDPPGNARTEFVELHNPTDAAIDLAGWSFTDGIQFTFPAGAAITPGGYVVVAMDPAAFLQEFGFSCFGPFGGKLSGEGELVVLSNALGVEIDRVEYKSTFPWPISPTSHGTSMELIHPSLDNDLGGSWRGSLSAMDYPELTYVPTGDTGWKWRKGNSEASSPTSAWRQNGFVEDGSWTTFQSPIGYGVISSTAGSLPLTTLIPDMQNNYRCIFARKSFTIAAGEVPSALRLRYCKDDGVLIWINGTLVVQRNMNTTDPTISTFAASDSDTEGLWYEQEISNAGSFLAEGVNTVAVQVFNGTLTSSDLGFDMELIRTAGSATFHPTPGARNTVYSTTSPPQIRQVKHSPQQPKSSQPITITAKVTDPQGVGQARLAYQIVAPGSYTPARFPRTVSQVMADPEGERPVNPDFEDPANWTTVVMADDGTNGDQTAADGVFTAVIPPQAHRTLVRYRIEAGDLPGTEVRVPYNDDESLNFACFVYDGVPDFVASTASVDPSGSGKVWPKALLTTLPVYHWIIRHEDMMTLQAYNSWEQFTNNGTDTELAARRAEEWEGAFVYDGVVYDHVRTRLRGGNSRYIDYDGRYPSGKRHYKFRFNDGHLFQARDQSGVPYPAKWKRLALNRMFGTKGGNGWGMPEEIGARLWRTFGVPAQYTHWIHFRVIDDAAEAPDQYNGDFWGLSQAVEEYDGSYLDTHALAKGNVYKMSDWIWDADRQRRYQSQDMVSDGSEFNNIRDNLHGAQNQAWLGQYVDYDSWYRYSAIAEGIRHYDIFPYINESVRHALKNLAWYFEPAGSDPSRGLCMFLPYDWDASFGPNFNNGWDHANNALYGWDMSTDSAPPGAVYIDKPAMKIEHRNVLREFRDLVWQPDQVNNLMDDRAAVIADFSKADQDRWRNAPASAGTANDDPLAWKIQDMKNFCFTGWSGTSGPAVGTGGRGAYLDGLADTPDAGQLPATPVISYAGAPGHPTNGLVFQCGGFADPQGTGTFGGMAWRVGETEDPSAPSWRRGNDFIMEYDPVWESGFLTSFSNSMPIPADALKPDHTYRARVRVKDTSGRWSHWSAPYQFTSAIPDGLADLQQNLMITEVMYNPPEPAPPGGSKEDYEYIELHNISSSLTLDLGSLSFTKGVDFDFANAAITSLAPGGYVLVVKNTTAFGERYGTGKPIAGAWDSDDNLSNGGEEIKLAYADGSIIHDFTYDDASPWPEEADGQGSAMILADPDSAPDHAIAANWTAGSPTPGAGAASDPFGDWLAAHNLSDPSAEFLPGMSCLLAYALGADLAAVPSTTLPATGFLDDANGRHLTLSFRRRADAPQMDYVVETSTGLTDWQSGPGVVETAGSPVDNGDGTETITVRVLATTEGTGSRFVRLRVTLTD